MTATPIESHNVVDASTSLEVRDIVKSFGAVRALRGVSFTARAGEVLGLLGDNGAGKTTLVKCLAGILEPDAGEILIDGRPVAITSPRASRSLGIETVHQDLSLIDSLDVAGNLFLNREEIRGPMFLRWFGWMNQPQMRRDAKATLDSLHINIPSVRRPIQRLSGGQRQAVAVGRAVAWGQRIVIMDEPSAALGVEQTRLVLDLIRQLQQRNVLVVLITHNMQQVVEVCTRAVVLRHGSVAGDITVGPDSARDLVDLITGAV